MDSQLSNTHHNTRRKFLHSTDVPSPSAKHRTLRNGQDPTKLRIDQINFHSFDKRITNQDLSAHASQFKTADSSMRASRVQFTNTNSIMMSPTSNIMSPLSLYQIPTLDHLHRKPVTNPNTRLTFVSSDLNMINTPGLPKVAPMALT